MRCAAEREESGWVDLNGDAEVTRGEVEVDGRCGDEEVKMVQWRGAVKWCCGERATKQAWAEGIGWYRDA